MTLPLASGEFVTESWPEHPQRNHAARVATPLLVLALGLCQCAKLAGFDDFSGAAALPVHPCASLPTVKEDPSGLGLMSRVDDPAATCSWIDQKEVTVERYQQFLTAVPANQVSWNQDYCAWKRERSDPISNRHDACTSQILSREELPFAPDKPIRCVDFCDAQAFCAWEGKELCHEEDNFGIKGPFGYGQPWFTACTNTFSTVYPWGNAASGSECNTGQTAEDCTTIARTCGVQRVGEYLQCVTEHGVYDLLGNVDEWIYLCNTRISGDPDAPRGCLAKGGGYDATLESCRLERTLRSDTRLPNLGFRCCAGLTKAEENERAMGVSKE